MARVLIGVSGGVDSAVAIHLLKQDKHEVVGAFMRNWDSMTNNDILGNPTINNAICPQEQDYEDAKKVCEKLGIELIRLDFVKEYWQDVFTYFIDEYKKNRTPNPDILCNKYIKFDYFLKYAIENNFDYIAMGHYAGIKHTNKGSFLLKAKDNNKDQTYFLSQLNQFQLNKALFPLENYTKQEVREIANELGLEIANKKDSTGICFIGERNFKEFLENYIPAKNGDIVDYHSNKVIGKHSGTMYYTIGQSKGLGIGGQKGFSDDKWYVVGKSNSKQIIYVSNDLSYDLLKCDKVLLNDIMINNDKFKGITKASAKFRYRQKEYEINIEWLNDNSAYITSDNELPLAITLGQACVLYKDNYCIGGGTIDKIYLNNKEISYE